MFVANVTQQNNICYGGDIGSATVYAQGGSLPYVYEWTDADGNVVSTTTTATGLAAGDYTVEVTDSLANKITYTITITQPSYSVPYKFGTECDYLCFLKRMSCCQADKVYKLVRNKRVGKKAECCVEEMEIMEEMLGIAECWYPDGTITTQEKKAYFALTVNSYLNNQTLNIGIFDDTILGYTFNTGISFALNMDAIIAQINAISGYSATYNLTTDNGVAQSTLFIYSDLACNMNGYMPDIKGTATITLLTSNGFQGGVCEVVAEPCLTEDEVMTMMESMKSICGCNCNLAKLTNDSLN